MPADLNDYFKKKNGNGGNNSGGGDGGNRKPPNFNLEPPKFFKDMGKKAGLLYALIAIIIIFVIAKPFTVINSGEVGIKSTAGKFDPNPMQPGFHFFIPFIQKIFVVDTKVRIMNYSSTEDLGSAQQRNRGIENKSAISVLDSRGLPVGLDLTVQYQLLPMSAPQTIATWGLSWEEKIINPVVRDIARSAVGQFTAEELPRRRNEIAEAIQEEIRNDVENQPGRPVELLTVQLREIMLPEKIKDQIERVQVAKQEAQRAEYGVEKANQEALRNAALAEGDAKAREIRAKGQGKAIRIEADANAYANKEISLSLSDRLLGLRQIQVQGKFNEALRENKDTKLFLTPGGAVPNIWVDSKDRQKTTSLSNGE